MYDIYTTMWGIELSEELNEKIQEADNVWLFFESPERAKQALLEMAAKIKC